MTLNRKNQNDILNNFGIEYKYNNYATNRLTFKPEREDKKFKINKLFEKIQKIENCELKSFAKNIVFSDGNFNNPIMIIGEAPGKREDEMAKPFVGDAGKLLDKMLEAINIKRENTYITNVVNYRPPDNRKPNQKEINRYSKFLKEHIYLINPKIIILMGSTAMEAIFSQKMKITKERGIWRKFLINDKKFNTIITFHPAYLLRKPEQKRYSWIDLKNIKKKIFEMEIKFEK